MIQMVNLQAEYQAIQPEIDTAISEVLQSGYFIGGPKVNQFAEAFATFMNAKHVIPCANGTDALQIAFMALGLQPGDEIIVPAFTYVAPAEAALLLGITPILVDINPDDYCINVNQIEEKITKKTKAIVAVHLFGQPANMSAIQQLAQKYGLYVIEDNAQATGAKQNGTLAGTFGHFGTTSFFPSKNLGCYGDGGAVITNDKHLATRAKQIANHGQSGDKFYHDAVGINSRLDAIQASILQVKLKYLPENLTNRIAIAKEYIEQFQELNNITLPKTMEGNTHTFHQFVIQIPAADRDSFRNYMKDNDIATGVYYPYILPELPPYHTKDEFPIADTLKHKIVALPIHPYLKQTEQNKIIQTVKAFFNG